MLIPSVVQFSLDAEEAGSLIATASEWLELDSQAEGIRFDSELVSCFLPHHSSFILTNCYFVPYPLGTSSRSSVCFVSFTDDHRPSSSSSGESPVPDRLRPSSERRFSQ